MSERKMSVAERLFTKKRQRNSAIERGTVREREERERRERVRERERGRESEREQ